MAATDLICDLWEVDMLWNSILCVSNTLYGISKGNSGFSLKIDGNRALNGI